MAIKHLGGNSRGVDMAEGQEDKEEKHNDHIDLLADATQQKGTLTLSISSGNRIEIDPEDFTDKFILHLLADAGSPSLDGDFTIVVPGTQRFFSIFNDTGFTCTVEAGGSPTGTTIDVIDAARALLHCDGENIEEMLPVYDMAFFISGTPTPGGVAGAFVAVRPFKIPINAPGSQAYALTSSASGEIDQVFDLQKNGASFGSVTFASLSNTGTFSVPSAVTFMAGDRLAVIAPPNTSPDTEETDIANVSITIKSAVTGA